MSNNYCFLCASDEGTFLDITSDNQTVFGDQLETCLTTKINIELPNKVCYKCAYELEQCTKFVKKYKNSHKTTDSKDIQPAELSCCLCLEFADNNHIFDITKDNRAIFNPVQKIRNIFNEDVTKRETGSKLICLTCRYNLDVLYDLKKLYQEVVINLKALITKQIDYSTFPKIHTDVVNRKTTVTTFPDITFYASLTSDSEDGETMSRSKSRNKSRARNRSNKSQNKIQSKHKTKIRTCDECHSVVANSNDMYRFHRTGLTVCKTCWITMDSNRNKGKRRNNTETKPCTVFLKDVLSEDSYKNEKSYKMKKDEDGNRLFVIMDDSSEERSSENSYLSVSSKTHHTANNIPKKQEKKRQIDRKSDVESTPVKLTKSMTQRSTRSTRSSKEREPSPEREQSPNIRVTRQGYKKTNAVSSDSDGSQLTSVKTRLRNSSELSKSATSSASPTESRNSKKRLKSEETIHSEYSDVSSNESNQNRKKRKTSDGSNKLVKSEVEVKRKTRDRTRSSSISSTEFKSPKSMEAKMSPEGKTEYICNKCNKTFDNKISSAEHRLTHLKQITLKLERVNIDSKAKQETKTDTQEGTSQEAELRSSRTTSIDKHSDDASEEIAINIDDDTDDDEEIFNVSKNKRKPEENEKQKIKSESEGSEKVDTTDVNAAEDESQKTEESTETQGIKDVATKKPEEESTTADQPLISDEKTEEKDTKDKDERNQVIKAADDVSKSSSIDETTEKPSKDEEKATVASTEDDQNTENPIEKIQTETDVEVPTERMEEQSVSGCNNDAKDVQEATTCNDETIESPVDNATKDQNKNCSNESENHCRDDDIHDKIEDAETAQDKTESQSVNNNERDKEEESEKKNQITLDITKTNDKKHSNDAAITSKVEIAKQQRNGEDTMTAEIMTEKLNDDVAKSDLSNCEKFDEMADCMENDDNVTSLANDEDTARSKMLTEEHAPKDEDSRENYGLEDGIKSLERLLKETATSEEYEVQENSNHAESNDSPVDAASEILTEVFELAAAEVQKREDIKVTKSLDENEMETLENISREIRNSADMPSLDPISVVELDENDDNNEDSITLD